MALGTVLARNLVHAALFLVAFFFIIACQFVLLEAEFLAAVHVLIYIGAIAILLLFGIMLTRNIQGDETTTVRWAGRLPAALAGLGVLCVLVYGITFQYDPGQKVGWRSLDHRPALAATEPNAPPTRTTAVNDMGRTLGLEMMKNYVVPFEVAGLLLTAALVGAVALAQLEGAEKPGGGGPGTRIITTTTDGSGNGKAPAPHPGDPVATSASAHS